MPTCGSTLRDTGFELVADAGGANAEGVWRQFELRRKPPPQLDFGPLFAAVVIENQQRLVRIQPAKTSIQTFEQQLAVHVGGRLLRLGRAIDGDRLLDVGIDLPDVFEQNELGDDVAVVRWRGVGNRALFFEATRNSVQSVVGESVGVETPLALEVADQPAPDVDITLAA